MTATPQTPAQPLQDDAPVVSVVMGSDSDWPVMSAAAEALRELDVPVEVGVVSAHRMPHEMVEFGARAHERGIRVIVAGAGGAAHLPGMLAAVTPLPVIGVPVKLKSLDGMDSLLSIVQMPAGVPVATVSIGGAMLRSGEPWGQWLQRADQCLYRAKSEGRNRTIIDRPAVNDLAPSH